MPGNPTRGWRPEREDAAISCSGMRIKCYPFRMRTTISIDDQLLKKTKLLAKQANLSLSEFIQACIQKALSSEKPLRNTKFKLITVKGEPLERKLAPNRISRILVAQDEEQF
jgi:hypothetical protein